MAKKRASKKNNNKSNGLNITFKSILIGIIGAVLVSASSFYIVLKFGALPWPTTRRSAWRPMCLPAIPVGR